jgi:hypothetical protein
MRLASLLFCLATVGFAETWSGYLVDSRCYARAQTNTSNDEISTAGSDMRFIMSQCAATHRTTHFALVFKDWTSMKLDEAGNERAATVVSKGNRKNLYCVTVTGSRVRRRRIATKTLAVASVRKVPRR